MQWIYFYLHSTPATFWSPWPWPQSLKSSNIAGLRTALFLNRWNFVGKRQKPRGKISKTFFVFLTWRSPEKIVWRPLSPEKIFKDLFLRSPEKNLRRTFFLRTLAPVSLVLGLDLGLDLGIFLCPWPWPRAMSPRIHLCFALTILRKVLGGRRVHDFLLASNQRAQFRLQHILDNVAALAALIDSENTVMTYINTAFNKEIDQKRFPKNK